MRGIAVALLLAGCQAAPTGPYEAVSGEARDTVRAQRLSSEAADLIDEDPEQAAELLREALSADIFFGPAHNNLGVLYLKEDKLYEAANEFEWARKLMPGHPDPRMNLALTLEKAGQVDEAIRTYETTLEVYPGHVPTLQALALLRTRRDLDTETLRDELETISISGETEEWRRWARSQLIAIDRE
jgi:Flp pilus assembly protein TadD